MSDDKLNIREKKFVQAVVSGQAKSANEAVALAGYSTSSPDVVSAQAHRLLSKPRIQNAITEAIKEEFPDVEKDVGRLLVGVLNNEREATAMRLKSVELLAKFFGWQAPTKHANLNLRGRVKDVMSLPGQEDEND